MKYSKTHGIVIIWPMKNEHRNQEPESVNGEREKSVLIVFEKKSVQQPPTHTRMLINLLLRCTVFYVRQPICMHLRKVASSMWKTEKSTFPEEYIILCWQ